MDYATFREIQCNLSAAIDGKPDPLVHRSGAKSSALPERYQLAGTWLEDDRTETDKPRQKAFLMAYVAAFGPSFDARGGAFNDGFVHWDKGVMKQHLKKHRVEIRNGFFHLTATGQNYLGYSDQ